MMVLIDKGKCTGCGLCVSTCSQDHLSMQDKIAVMHKPDCFGCGHCAALCPVGAVMLEGCDPTEIVEYSKASFDVPHENMMNTIKFRRSLRRYTDKKVEPEKLHDIIEAGRYSPTGGNAQLFRYVVIENSVKEMTDLTLRSLYHMIMAEPSSKEAAAKMFSGNTWYVDMIKEWFEDYERDGKDRLFHHAPMVIAIIGPARLGVDAGIASANMELSAVTQGLGTCYIGFFKIAAALCAPMQQKLNLQPGETVLTAFTVGYPSITYRRTTKRNAANVTIL